MTILESIAAARVSVRRVYGPDIDLMVARCPAWGSNDVCIIVRGQQHQLAARAFLAVEPTAQIDTQTICAVRGRPAYTYSTVTFGKEIQK